MGMLLSLQVDSSGWMTLRQFGALTSATKCQARETRRLLWVIKCMIRAELFLREKDEWWDSATHMECVFEEMLRSAKHVGIRERDCQYRHWEKKDHSPPWAPTTSCATTLKQIGSGNNHQLVRSLVEEVYQGHLEIGQCQLTADKLGSLLEEIKYKLRAHMQTLPCWLQQFGSNRPISKVFSQIAIENRECGCTQC